jgi:hypothetical protein
MMYGQYHAIRVPSEQEAQRQAYDQVNLDLILQSGEDARQYSISWTYHNGGTSGVASGWIPESKAGVVAWADVLASAIESGWTPRAWWKFWRVEDTKNPSNEVIARAYEIVLSRLNS